MNRNKYFIAGAALVAGVLVVYFAISGFPPGGEVAGTMAAPDTAIAGVEQAERYRADAISDADVQLDDQAINDLLQDPDVVAALQDENFRTALTDGSLTAALRSSKFEDALRRNDIRLALTNTPALLDALRNQKMTEFLKDENALRKLNPVTRDLLRDENALRHLQTLALKGFITDDYLRGKFDNALRNENFLRSIKMGVVDNALKDANFLRRLGAVDDM